MATRMQDEILDRISVLSKVLPPYLIEQYEKILSLHSILPTRPLQATPDQFWDLYTRLSSPATSIVHPYRESRFFPVTYTYHILKGLGWNETELRPFLIGDFQITDPDVNGKIQSLQRTTISAIQNVVYTLDIQLGDFQCSRYRLALIVLTGNRELYPPGMTFFQMYSAVKDKFGSEPLAMAFTSAVLKRSNWGNIKDLKHFSSPGFRLDRKPYQRIDLALTVADYFSNMTDSDYRSAKVFLSAVHLEGRRVSDVGKIDFVLLLLNAKDSTSDSTISKDLISPGDVSKIEDTRRYPIFFNDYKKRYAEATKVDQTAPPQVMCIPQMEKGEGNPSTTTDLSITSDDMSSRISAPETCTEDDDTDGSHVSRPSTLSTPTLSSSSVVQSDRGHTSSSSSSSSSSNRKEHTYLTTAHSEKGPGDDVIMTSPPHDRDPSTGLPSLPQVNDVLRLLTPMSEKWEILGLCLGVHVDQMSSTDDGRGDSVTCLERVINEWIRNGSSSVTWTKLIFVLKKLGENEVVTEIQKFINS